MFYETIDDVTADAGIRVKAKDLEELFCKALLATFNEITDIDKIEAKVVRSVRAKNDLPFLLADLINSAILLHEREGFVARECVSVNVKLPYAEATLRGDFFDPGRHTSKLVIKAATYYRLKVEREGDLYTAEVIFDI